MNHKLLTLIAAPLLLASCSSISTEEQMANYSNCIVYSYDSATGSGVLSDFATITVTGDYATRYYKVEFADFQLAEGQPLRSASAGHLTQYMMDETDSDGNLVDIHYTLFKQEPSMVQSGDMELSEMYMGWLSTCYWLNFTANERYKVWSLPSRVPLYANKNEVKSQYGSNYENAISPRYDMTISAADRTVTLKATGVKYPVDNQDTHKTWSFRSLNWENLPAQFTERGIKVELPEFYPRVDGNVDTYLITNFTLTFDYSYEGTHQASFSIRNLATGESLYVTTTLDYFLQQNA